MKLKVKLQTITAVYLCFTVIFGCMIFGTLDAMRENSRKNRLASAIVKDAFDLGSFIEDYLLSHKERTYAQWMIKQKELADKINEGLMLFKTPEHRETLNIISQDADDIASAFNDLQAYDEKYSAEGQKSALNEKFRKYLVQRLMADSHRIISNGFRLEYSKYAQLLGLQEETQIIILTLGVLLSVLAVVSLFMIFKSLERPIRMLQKGAQMVGAGNLNYRIGISGSDEIGDLSRAFDRMTDNLKKSEEQLRFSEARLKELFDHMSSGVVVYETPDHGQSFFIVDFNAAAEKIEKIKKENVIGKKVDEVFPGIGQFGLLDIFKKVWETGISVFHPVGFYQDERIVGWRENYVYKLPTGEIVAVYDDVTKRKLAEDELRHEREFIRALLENMVDGVVACDHKGLLVLFNRTAREWLGMDPVRIPQEEWAAHYHLYCADGTTPLGGEEVPLVRAYRGETVRNMKLVIRAKGQPARFIMASAVPFFGDERQKLGAVAVLHDVTEERRIQEALSESEKNFRALAENANDGIFVVTQDQAIAYLNQRAAELMGSVAGDIGKTRLEDVFPPEDFQTIRKHLNQVFEKESAALYCQSLFIRGDGEKLTVELTGAKTVWQGDPAMILMMRDITERKKIEEFKNEMLRNVSHELRTPLHSMREGVSVVLDGLAGEISDQQRDVLNTTRVNLDRLARLVNSFLDFQRLEAGLLKFDRRLQSMNELVLEAVETLRPSAQAKGLQIESVLSGNLQAVEVDGDRILQVLINLIGNGIKFTEKGSVIVSTFMREEQICVSVKDTGIGMKPEEFPKLFKQFTQLESGKQHASTGTGLGLAISRSIIELHGGRIWAESKWGEGSTFFFGLSAARPV